MGKKLKFSDIGKFEIRFGDDTITLNEMQNNFEDLVNNHEMDANEVLEMGFIERKKTLIQLSKTLESQ